MVLREWSYGLLALWPAGWAGDRAGAREDHPTTGPSRGMRLGRAIRGTPDADAAQKEVQTPIASIYYIYACVCVRVYVATATSPV